MNNIVVDWFGEGFQKLDPLLQELHTNGGMLSGNVKLEYGEGIAGTLGKKIGKKLGLPLSADQYDFEVKISQREERLIWFRKFNDKFSMTSVFEPCDSYPNGHWKESTGKVTLELGVDIQEGGWYWVQKNIKLNGVVLPKVFFPRTHAYKRIINGKYEFSVTLTYPLIGKLISYSGLLIKS